MQQVPSIQLEAKEAEVSVIFKTSDADSLLAYWWVCEGKGKSVTGPTRQEAIERWVSLNKCEQN